MSGFNSNGVLQVTGAYGRKVSKDDWVNGKDFKIISGPYFSIRDIEHIKSEDYGHIEFYDMSSAYVQFVINLD